MSFDATQIEKYISKLAIKIAEASILVNRRHYLEKEHKKIEHGMMVAMKQMHDIEQYDEEKRKRSKDKYDGLNWWVQKCAKELEPVKEELDSIEIYIRDF